MTPATPSLMRYVLMYLGTYALCLVVIMVITAVFDFNVPSSMGIITVMAALSYPLQMFVRNERRVFSRSERLRFASGVGFATTALSVGLALLVLAFVPNVLGDVLAGAKRQGFSAPVVIGGLAAFSFVLTWVVAYAMSGFMQRQVLKQLEKVGV
jgi:hypothetical protein